MTGSCTMKLNATSEMIPVTWPEFANNIHPGRPSSCRASAELDRQLRDWLPGPRVTLASACSPMPAHRENMPVFWVIKAYLRRGPGPPRHSPDSRLMAPTRRAQMAGMTVWSNRSRCYAGNVITVDQPAARTANAWPA
jgi:glycine cleavage system protein P-like pyridoxal-binding family